MADHAYVCEECQGTGRADDGNAGLMDCPECQSGLIYTDEEECRSDGGFSKCDLCRDPRLADDPDLKYTSGYRA